MAKISPQTATRHELVRTRVEDWIGSHGGTRSVAAREDAEKMFVRRAVSVARSRGMRIWSEKSFPAEVNALKSLRYLLKEHRVRSKNPASGQPTDNTGGNVHWVMDIWEATIDEIAREAPRPPARPPDPARDEELHEPLARTTDRELRALNGEGVAVFAARKSLAMRVLEAYTDRDDSAMLELMLEIENIEREV